MDNLISILTDNWILGIVVLIIALFIITSIIRATIKLAIAAVIIGGILVIGFGMSGNDLLKTGKAAIDSATSMYQKTIEPVLNQEIDDADFTVKPDGEYVIKGSHFKITGKKGQDKVTIEYKNKTYTIDNSQLSEHIQEKIKEFEKQSNDTSHLKN